MLWLLIRKGVGGDWGDGSEIVCFCWCLYGWLVYDYGLNWCGS